MLDTTQVQIDVDKAKEGLKKNPEFFIHFLLGDELTHPVPDFHINIFGKMTDMTIRLFACAVPRDHAKTTLAKLTCVWYYAFVDKARFVVYLSNTWTVAKDACLDIINFIRSNNFSSIFGEVEFLVSQESRGFWKFKIGLKTCILKALGAGQQVRGLNIDNQRPQVAVVDDLEDAEEIQTKEAYIKLKRWFFGTFRKALDKFWHKIIQIGNMVNIDCILKDNINSPYWHSMRFGCILSNGKPLWEDAWSIEKLAADFNEYLDAGMVDVWFAEMMNNPIAEGTGLIKASEIQYNSMIPPGEIEYGFITLDPAISAQNWAHKAALVAHGWVDEHWQIVDYRQYTGADPIFLLDEIIDMCWKWKIGIVGIEGVQFQAALEPVYSYIVQTRGITDINFYSLYYVGMKVQRLATFAGMIKSGEYKLTSGDFIATEQLLMFNPRKKENDCDLIDSCSYGPQMIREHIVEIQEKRHIVQQSSIKDSYQTEEQAR